MATEPGDSSLPVCDLVMKGGITSGIVYPPAVFKLREKYRFRSIGGTSAGAIAAALTAAAEYDREGGGFGRFEEAQKEVGKGRFLFNLFQPARKARPLMNALLELRGRKSKGAVGLLADLYSVLPRAHPKAFWIGASFGAVAGVMLFLLAVLFAGGTFGGWGFVAAGLFFVGLFGAIGGLAYGAYDLYRILNQEVVHRNFYGLCTGRGENLDSLDVTALTDWLYATLNHLAGKTDAHPLTFDDLAKKEVQTDEKLGRIGISLKMVTTNLNHGEPYVFPREENTFLFREEEMKEFFPKEVVDYMREHRARPGENLPDGYYFLPQGNELPVIVAVRMSLAFPILLSAVPLYTINPDSWTAYKDGSHELGEEDLQRNWFSDGGICSNFPIHFFDAWLPKCPTFGINLMPSKPEGERVKFSVSDAAKKDEPGESDDVRLPKPEDPGNPEFAELQGIGEFAWAIFSSAQNYRDNTQSRLPSYRERVVQVRLNKDEGGLNLDMPEPIIQKIEEKGEEAASEILGFNFEHHLWVRFRVLMNELETHLKEANQVLGSKAFEELLEEDQAEGFPYARSEDWREEAQRHVKELSELIERWQERDGGEGFFFPVSEAEPHPDLRVTAEL